MITRGDDFSKEKSFVFDPKQDLRSPTRLFMKVHYGFYNLLVMPLNRILRISPSDSLTRLLCHPECGGLPHTRIQKVPRHHRPKRCRKVNTSLTYDYHA